MEACNARSTQLTACAHVNVKPILKHALNPGTKTTGVACLEHSRQLLAQAVCAAFCNDQGHAAGRPALVPAGAGDGTPRKRQRRRQHHLGRQGQGECIQSLQPASALLFAPSTALQHSHLLSCCDTCNGQQVFAPRCRTGHQMSSAPYKMARHAFSSCCVAGCCCCCFLHCRSLTQTAH